MVNEIKTTAEAYEASAIPRAHAAMADPNAQPTAEQRPLPESVLQEDLSQKSPAQWAYERIILYIQNFEEQLDAEHEVGMGIAGGEVGAIHIQGLGYFAPDIITFYGTDDEGNRMQLVQHVTQLNVMLLAAPKVDDEPNRIGFQLAEKLASIVPVQTPLNQE